ncbi:DUF58 domain-containing protein [Candidatus Halobeggiatoa sp. HSG11]|nr:DUF58 domain-containing protein [Candidatus Halobeggiatoa sp. HSG11]
MLTPQLKELLELRYQANSVGLVSSQRTQTMLSGLYASVFRGHGMNFEEVREYQSGDEIRNIDWRVTARMNRPYLKIYREERERSVMLCVDTGVQMQFGTCETFKAVQAAKVAALLGWSAYGHGDRVGGLLFGQQAPKFFRPNRSQRSLGQILRNLTIPPNDKQDSSTLEKALQVLNRSSGTGSLLFVITDFNQADVPTLQRTLSQLRQHHEIVLISIDDPADYDLPAVGQVGFVTPDGTKVYIDTDSKAGRIAYRKTWETKRQDLKQMVQGLFIDLFNISTQDNVYNSLFKGLQQRVQNRRTHR